MNSGSRAHTHTHWTEACAALRQAGTPHVLVTLLDTRGSTPRTAGTKMVVAEHGNWGSIGGGNLEFRAMAIAGEMLAAGLDQQRIEDFPLGAKLGQCCGGHTQVLFECFAGAPLQIALFGAGHVGRALAGILGGLPCRVRWVDSRTGEFPDSVPANTAVCVSDSPVDEIADLPAGTFYLFMTHEHPLDYALAEKALARGDAGYIGLTGSLTKWRRFRLRLQHRGYSEADIAQIHCPVGLPDVPGKYPMEVAVSIAGQLIATYHASGVRSEGADIGVRSEGAGAPSDLTPQGEQSEHP
ncbi:MAG: xanthine dehydrogenase accessory protein XdhC [Chromatocurvus sp.]